MAINLVARMSLEDKFSSPMKRINKAMGDTERASSRLAQRMQQQSTLMGRMGNVAGKTSAAFSGMGSVFSFVGRGAGKLLGFLNPLNGGFLGVAAAAGAAYSAVKVFNATVGEAMKMQQSQVIIGAMFDDKKLSSQYMKMLDKVAINSPLLDSQAMYGNSKSFVTASKDIGQLEKMWNLTERLVASDPEQGVEGAVRALRELFSGDAISIVDRFEMPRKVMNEIKKLPIDKQLTKLDEYFNKIGLTTKLIDEMGGTALGMWQQVKERFQLVLRDMGEPSLKAVSKFLGGLLDRLEGEDMQKFANWGGKVIEKMVSGLSNNAIKLYDWFTALINDPEFQSKTTITAKVQFIVNDIAERLQAWYDSGGKDSLITFGTTVAEVLVGALDKSPAFFDLGSKLGAAIWSGIETGLTNSAKTSKLGAFLSMGAMSWDIAKNPILTDKFVTSLIKTSVKNKFGKGTEKSHSGGLERVPFDGYNFTAHKDEMILTAEKAKEYRNGGGNGGVMITGNTFNVRQDSDIEAIAMALARLIEVEGAQMA